MRESYRWGVGLSVGCMVVGCMVVGVGLGCGCGFGLWAVGLERVRLREVERGWVINKNINISVIISFT